MGNNENEQKFPLTALIIILICIVLMSLVLMSMQDVLLPSPTEKKVAETEILDTSENSDSLYFHKVIPTESQCNDGIVIPPLFGKTVLKSMDHYDLKEYKEAENLLRTLHLYYPQSALVARLLGNTLFASKQYAEAERYYITSLKLGQSHSAVIYNDLAMSQAMQGKYIDAIRNMEKSIQYGGGSIEKSEWNLAGLYLRAGRKEDSLKLFLSLLKKTPPALLKGIKWVPVFQPLFQNKDVQSVLKEKTVKEYQP